MAAGLDDVVSVLKEQALVLNNIKDEISDFTGYFGAQASKERNMIWEELLSIKYEMEKGVKAVGHVAGVSTDLLSSKNAIFSLAGDLGEQASKERNMIVKKLQSIESRLGEIELALRKK